MRSIKQIDLIVFWKCVFDGVNEHYTIGQFSLYIFLLPYRKKDYSKDELPSISQLFSRELYIRYQVLKFCSFQGLQN